MPPPLNYAPCAATCSGFDERKLSYPGGGRGSLGASREQLRRSNFRGRIPKSATRLIGRQVVHTITCRSCRKTRQSARANPRPVFESP